MNDPRAASAQPRFPDGPLVILGASYAKGWLPAVAGRRVLNKGIEGQQSWEFAARFDADVLAERPRAVVIWGFINDITRSQPARMDQTLARVRQSYDEMIAAARAAGVEPILATELTLAYPNSWADSFKAAVGWVLGKTSYQAQINGHVIGVNRWLRERAGRDALLLIDLHALLSGADGGRTHAFATPDGSHVPPAGYAEINRHTQPILEQRLGRSGS